MKSGLGRPGLLGWAPVALLLLALGCQEPRGDARPPTESEQRMASERIDAILKRYAPEWLRIPGVTGVAEGRTPEGVPCVLVLAASRKQAAAIPDEIEGIPVRFQESDSIRALGPGR
jgi:hypothetical protein